MKPKMADTDQNVATVGSIFASMARGQIDEILSRLRADVDWEFGASDLGIPWLKPGVGKEHARNFFASMHLLEVHHFNVLAHMGSGPWVVTLVVMDFTVRATGKRVFEPCQPTIWRFDEQGLVAAVRHGADRYQHYVAAGSPKV